MSQAYRDESRRAEAAAAENVENGFGVMARLLADQVTTADRQYSELLGQVLDCLTQIKNATRGGETLASGAESRATEGSSGAAPGWDRGAAEALARSYEDAAAGLDGAAKQGGAGRGGLAPEDPFAAMASQIERAFAPAPAEGSFLSLSLRFDDLERRVQSVLGGWPPKPELARETAGEPAAPPDGAKREAARFEGIENLLSHVVERLSDERLAKVFDSARAVRLEQAEPEKTPPREQPSPPADVEAMTDRMEELCGVVDHMIDDHRRGSEAALAMMTTLQEAMVRVLDRLDAVQAARETERRPGFDGAAEPGDASPSEARYAPLLDGETRLDGAADGVLSPGEAWLPADADHGSRGGDASPSRAAGRAAWGAWPDWAREAKSLVAGLGDGWFTAARAGSPVFAGAAARPRRGAAARAPAPTLVMIFLFGVLIAIEAANLFSRAPRGWGWIAPSPPASAFFPRPAAHSGAIPGVFSRARKTADDASPVRPACRGKFNAAEWIGAA